MEIKQLKTKLLKSVYLLLALISITSSQLQAASTVTFYHHDALGSTIASSDENGNIHWNEEYQPYGEKIYALGKDNITGNQNWFTGKNYDEDLDLTYFGARWYDAKQGRFLSIDPAPVVPGNIHTFNRYHYANNNPYKFVDPDGEFAAAAMMVVGVAVSTFVTIDNAINEYDRNTSVTSSGISTGGLKAAGKSLAIDSAISVATLGTLSSLRLIGTVTKETTTVIGRVGDLQKLNKNEKSLLDRLPNQGSPKANWKQNSGVLREEMGKGKPIRDASPGDTKGQFLNAERNLLENRDWKFDKSSNMWNPPK